MPELQDESEDGYSELGDCVRDVELPVWKRELNSLQREYLDRIAKVSYWDNQKYSRTGDSLRIAEEMYSQSSLDLLEYRREVAQLFLFMMRCASTDFPQDILAIVSRSLNSGFLDGVQREVAYLVDETRKLKDELLFAKRELERISYEKEA